MKYYKTATSGVELTEIDVSKSYVVAKRFGDNASDPVKYRLWTRADGSGMYFNDEVYGRLSLNLFL